MKNLLITIISLFMIVTISAQQDKPSISKGTVLEKISAKTQIFDETNAKIIFQDDFETDNKLWKSNGKWKKGNFKNTLSKSVSTKSYFTNSGNEYLSNTKYQLISPAISLKDIKSNSKIILSFDESYEIESGYDKGYIKISKDGGKNWIIIGKRDGKSNRVHSQIDISSYKNNNIKIKFELITDAEDNFKGWTIDNVTVSTKEIQNLGLSITSLNSQNFPYLYMNVAVEEDGFGLNNLDQGNFKVFENNVLQTDNYVVTPPKESGGVRVADIVFVLDVTGSMSEEIEAVKNNMLSFINALDNSNVNYLIGFVVFGDIIYKYNNGNLYSDKNQIINIIENITLGENGIGSGDDYPENQLGALASASVMNFRPGAQKDLILLTDASAHEADGVTSWTVNSLISMLTSNNSIVYPIFDISQSDQLNQYVPIANNTNPNGTYYDIYDNFNDIINDIEVSISNTYVINYRSSNPNFDGTERTVRCEVSYNSQYNYDIAYYTPGASPTIKRTEQTLNLHKQAWAEYTTFNIDAEIIDNIYPYLQNAALYYKNTNTNTYNSVSMYNIGGNIYRGVIPSSTVVSPGIDYYITASDGQSTSSDPKTNPSVNKYQIAILPNAAPTIEHFPISISTSNNPIEIKAVCKDNTNLLSAVTLYYRKKGQLLYQNQTMTYVGSDTYQSVIPGEYAVNNGVEYFIYAYDDFGIGTYNGTVDYPHFIFITSSNTLLWELQNSGVSYTLWDVDFIDTNNGWIVGGGKTVLKTTDAGENWNNISVPTNEEHLRGVYFINKNIGWICGYNSLILKTTSGGKNWTKQSVAITQKLRDIFFVNENFGFSVGDSTTILRTTDGGNNWQNILHDLPNMILYSVYFTSLNRGFAVGDNRILKTDDGGLTWDISFYHKDIEFKDVQFFNNDLGWAVGRNWNKADNRGVVLKTVDGGNNWIFQEGGLYGNTMFSISLVDNNNGFISGNFGTIFKTSNSGDNWTVIKTDLSELFLSNDFVNRYKGWAVGTKGSIMRYFADDSFVHSINLLTPEDGATLDNGCLSQSNNIEWDFNWEDVTNATKYNIYVIGENATIPAINSETTVSELHSSERAYIAEENRYNWKWKVRAFANDSWGPWSEERTFNVEPVNTDCPYTLNLISPQDSAVMDNGCSDQSDPIVWEFDWDDIPNAALYNLFVIGPITSIPLLNIEVDTSSFKFVDNFFINDRMLEGWTWKVRAFVDSNWTSWSNTRAFDVEPLNTDCPVGVDENSLPTKFQLSQNYPNPFNPTTTIKYSIPTPPASSPLAKGSTDVGFVTLKIYDVLGKEIATLVNKKQASGNYTVNFNAANLPSGIYFYRLTAGSFTETKKMILLE